MFKWKYQCGLLLSLVCGMYFVLGRILFRDQECSGEGIGYMTSGRLSFQQQGMKVLDEDREPSSLPDSLVGEGRRTIHSTEITKITIYAKYRTGSTFVSELFNQNPAVFYTFEPLKLCSAYAAPDTERIQCLGDVYQCNFSSLVYKSRAFMSPKDRSRWTRHVFNYELLRANDSLYYTTSYKSREKTCLRRSVRVAKLITVKKLVSLFNFSSYIIHLVRDPRGVVSSRLKIGYETDYKKLTDQEAKQLVHDKAKFYCMTLNNDLNDIKSANHMKYKLLRYEDAALAPEKLSMLIYSYVNLTLPPEVKSWIKRSTSGGNATDTYGTKRNSKQTAFNWQDYLPASHIKIIEDECEPVMRKLGYLNLNDTKRTQIPIKNDYELVHYSFTNMK